MNKKRIKFLLPFAVLPFILLLAYGLIIVARPLSNVKITYDTDGVFDLRNFDFENHIFFSVGYMEIVKNKLLSPQEFDAHFDGEKKIDWDGIEHNTYLTTRTTFLVDDEKWYTFTRKSLDHSHRLFVNGNLLVEIGNPNEISQNDIPDNGRITFTAQGVDGKIILVQQSSNHFHRYGEPWLHERWLIGTGTALANAIRAEHYQTNIILGVFLAISFLFLLLFFTHVQNRAALYFSLFCLVWFVRIGVTGNKIFSVLFPQMDWFVRLHIEYLSLPASAVLTLAIINSLFPKILHKAALYIFCGISAVFAFLFLAMETLPMTFLMDWVFKIYGAGIAYIFFALIAKQFLILKKINSQQIIFIFGLIIFFLAVLADFEFLPRSFRVPQYHLTGVAMLVFALCEASAIFIAVMREREEILASRFRLSAEVAVLENLSQRKNEYYAAIQTHIEETNRADHDLRHHLSVIQSYTAAGENKKLAEYLREYVKSLPDNTYLIFCENFAVNSILQYYFGIAKR
ncbi:MAG: 7TM-DISM domain-containing protein, partial [Defluviitaleaceae bacterium]|nr:7TM-DISM domain-containing protein [Defluviitaleaceae bacterium]